MASTNKTTYYELSQYIGTDKPTYLGDYNGDMGKIDTGIHTAQEKANEIGTLSNLTTDSKTNVVSAINEVDSHSDTNASNINSNTVHIGDLTDLDTTIKTDLVSAINELKTNIANFNLTSYSNLSSISATGATVNSSDVKIAKNSDGSLAKIYGNISFTSTVSGSQTIIISGSGLTPSQEIVINNAGIIRISDSAYSPSTVDITIKTNGNIEISRSQDINQTCLIMLLPILYFIKDFGDVPIN